VLIEEHKQYRVPRLFQIDLAYLLTRLRGGQNAAPLDLYLLRSIRGLANGVIPWSAGGGQLEVEKSRGLVLRDLCRDSQGLCGYFVVLPGQSLDLSKQVNKAVG
jgi:hypothetical protein